jgi:hypothetical protein
VLSPKACRRATRLDVVGANLLEPNFLDHPSRLVDQRSETSCVVSRSEIERIGADWKVLPGSKSAAQSLQVKGRGKAAVRARGAEKLPELS